METQYQPHKIEASTRDFWTEKNCFQVSEDPNKEKFYCLSMFPYPSGRLHMGHVRNYTIGDVISRYQRMRGKNVLQPMGWDAFGLPAENAAIKNKIPPAQWTYQNIEIMRQQMIQLGLAYDWSREVTTCKPDYYRWEQWFFIQLYKNGLVYKKSTEVNWDPVDQTVLANEQVVDGRGWRSGALVERREVPQWFLKITAYADELLNDLDTLEGWPEQVKTMQRNWIGRSQGVEIFFEVEGAEEPLTVFTTRPDTLFGVTYIAIAPQHPLARQAAEQNPELHQFLEECRNIKVAEAELATIEKRGVPLQINAIHPLTQEKIPVWAANFVVMDYGTGAVMSVPAHDQRDFEFAQKFGLPLKQVVVPSNGPEWDFNDSAFTVFGTLIDSHLFSGLDSKAAQEAIAAHLETLGKGKRKVSYRLRDWSISRQRYWGAPIPMINCSSCGPVPVPEADLPVILPEEVKFSGVFSPLKSIPEFYKINCPKCGAEAERETDTFDTFFESSWYFARYACKNQDQAMLDGRVNYWLPVDQYIGGIEHAVMHLLYSRFINKAMRDEGLLNNPEPFTRLLTQGLVLNQGIKMSKSKGNVVDPQALIERYGADTVRLFIMFASPPDQSMEWSDTGVEGAHRFLKRLWSFAYENHEDICKSNSAQKADAYSGIDWDKADGEHRGIMRQVYEIFEQARYDYERQQYNTVVSGCMKMLNLLSSLPPESKTLDIDVHRFIISKGLSILLRLLAPIAPHITHQLWLDLHYEGIIIDAPWPKSSLASLKADEINLVVQVNGKIRSKISVPDNAEIALIEKIALADKKVQPYTEGKAIKKIITVPGKLVNIVAGE
jgi:leucyl-tRNA synthetase